MTAATDAEPPKPRATGFCGMPIEVSDALTTVGEKTKEVGVATFEWSKENVPKGVDWAKENVPKAIDAAKPHVEKGIEWTKENGPKAVDWVKENGPKAMDAAKPYVEATVVWKRMAPRLSRPSRMGRPPRSSGGVAKDPKKLVDDAKDVSPRLSRSRMAPPEMVKDVSMKTVDVVKDGATKTVDFAKDQDLLGKAQSFATKTVDVVKDGATKTVDFAKEQDLVGKAQGLATSTIDAVKDPAKLANDIKDGAMATVDAVKDPVKLAGDLKDGAMAIQGRHGRLHEHGQWCQGWRDGGHGCGQPPQGHWRGPGRRPRC